MTFTIRLKTAITAVAAGLSMFCAAAIAQQGTQDGKGFASARAAAHALAGAVQSGNEQAMLEIFGSEGKNVVSSGDPQEDKEGRENFSRKYREMHRLTKEPDGTVTLYIGAENWPFPIPLVEKNGMWHFDTDAGKQEILFRRIGRNELTTISVCRELVKAEQEHFAGAHAGEAGEYAQKFSADEGRHNGLYHPVTNGQPEIGPLLAQAAVNGGGPGESRPFHGYYYRILKRQGADAPGGAQDYIVNGKMTAGVAFVAFPAEYKSSGVMTFIVNKNGVVYEKDLGGDTGNLAHSMQEYNPDSTWKRVD
jgi:hypothetical protein